MFEAVHSRSHRDRWRSGSSQEEELAQLIRDQKRSRSLPTSAARRQGTRFSHAGAIIEGGRGTTWKSEALREPGLLVDALVNCQSGLLDSKANEWTKSYERNRQERRVEYAWRVELTGSPCGDTSPNSWGASLLVQRCINFDGELPAPPSRSMDAILVASVDHGATPPARWRPDRRIDRGVVERVRRRRDRDQSHHGGAIGAPGN
jgi:hypothetical protein